MTWLAYSMGAVLYRSISHEWSWPLYILGYLIIFLIELCSIFINEYYDFNSDAANRNYSPFTGGSRVLVEGKLQFAEVIRAIRIILICIAVSTFLLANIKEGSSWSSICLLVAAGLFLGVGYTRPPMKFCYRGCGEIVVGLTHSFYVIFCGFIFQGGGWSNPLPWLLSIPLFFAILAAILMAGVPDREADSAAGKKTFAVLAGSRSAALVAVAFVIFSCLAGLLLFLFKVINISPVFWAFLILPHALFLIYELLKFLKSKWFDRRIDKVLVISLSYILWFGLLPFISMW